MSRADAPLLPSSTRAWTVATAGLALLPLLLLLPPGLAVGFAGAAAVVTYASWARPLPAWLRLLLALAMLALVLAMMGPRLGRDTGCALLAAMLAIKPGESHHLRDARSLLGFSLFAPFAAFLLDQGPLSMLLGLAAVLSALLALQRLADVENQATPLPLRERLRVMGRLVAIGLPLALAAFWLFPRLATPLWGVPERAVARPGLADRMEPGTWIDFMADDTPALRVRFDTLPPAPEQLYWRGTVLWNYDGRAWTREPGLDLLPPPALQPAGGDTWAYELEMEPTDRRQLVALDLPLHAPDGAQLGFDHTLACDRPLASLSRWHLRSAPARQRDLQLHPRVRALALALPPGRDPRTRELARHWRAEAGDDDVAIVQRALDWIRAEFGYTLEVPLPARDAADQFLFELRQGYCEQFSSSFAILMRAAGVPARVVIGYAGGYRNPFADYWIVRRMDAHAWVEVWLEGRGWTRVDPTAAVAPERVYDTLEQRRAMQDAGAGLRALRLHNVGHLTDWLRRGWNDLVLGFNAQRQQALLRPLGLQRLEPAQLLLAFAALAALALAAMAWWLARAERERDPLLRAWHRLGRRYARLGLGRATHEPALAWAQRVAAARPQSGAELVALSQRFADSRYAPVPKGEMHQLVRDLRRHRP